MDNVSTREFWNDLYKTGGDGWELGQPSPPIVAWLASDDAPRSGLAVVPGCGRGHEVLALAARGIEAVGLDFAGPAIAAGKAEAARLEAARQLAAPARFVEVDLFEAPRRADLAGQFDLVIEHTCFCAIDPARRDEYVDAVAALLRPGGRLVGLFYAHGRPGGPPFDTNADEVRRRFGRRFRVDQLSVAEESIERRRGFELLAKLTLLR